MKNLINQIGNWKYPKKKFVFLKTILFKSTNMMGNTYFSNYVEWQGEAREKLLLEHPAASIFLKSNKEITMLTYCVYHRFIINTFFGDIIRIEMTSREIQKYSAVLVFRYYNDTDDALIGEGWQRICFSNTALNTFCEVPQLVLDLIEPIFEK